MNGGDGGIRTLDTLMGYAHLANECLQPLGHVSVERLYARSHTALTSDRFEQAWKRRDAYRGAASAPRLVQSLDEGQSLGKRLEYRAGQAFILGFRQPEAHRKTRGLAADRDRARQCRGAVSEHGSSVWHGVAWRPAETAASNSPTAERLPNGTCRKTTDRARRRVARRPVQPAAGIVPRPHAATAGRHRASVPAPGGTRGLRDLRSIGSARPRSAIGLGVVEAADFKGA